MDYYLKANDETSLWSALETAGLAEKNYDISDPLNVPPEVVSVENPWSPTGKFAWRIKDSLAKTHSISVIGVIYKDTGNKIEMNGIQYPERVATEGYHANLRLVGKTLTEEQINLLPLIEAPSTPVMVWA